MLAFLVAQSKIIILTRLMASLTRFVDRFGMVVRGFDTITVNVEPQCNCACEEFAVSLFSAGEKVIVLLFR